MDKVYTEVPSPLHKIILNIDMKVQKKTVKKYGQALGGPIVAQWVKSLTSILLRMWIQSLASLSGLRILSCHKLLCRSQMLLRSCVAVAAVQVSSCGSNSTPSLGMSICHMYGPKKKKKKKKYGQAKEYIKNFQAIQTGV